MAINVIKSKCKGCNLCVKACPFNAIDLIDKMAVINSSCTVCNQCISVCPFDAIEKEEIQEKVIDLSEYKDVWIFAEQRGGKLMEVALEILGEGYKLSREIGPNCKICAVLAGSEVELMVDELYAYGADKVYVIENPLLKNYTTDGYTKVMTEAITKYKPEIVLFGATHIGRDLAPRIAARLNTGLTADCTRLDISTANYMDYLQTNTTADTSNLDKNSHDKNLKQTRPAFGGNLMATIVCTKKRPQMSTVRPGVMDKREKDISLKGLKVAVECKIEESDIRTNVMEIIEAAKELVSLTDAEIIISGGRGLGDPSGFELISKLAEKVGGVVGASRAAVDSGWIDHSHQVGQTGTTVKPRIYFACGISGAIQHVCGMQNSDIIIAINKDIEAPIMQIADYAIHDDLFKIIPEIIEQWDK